MRKRTLARLLLTFMLTALIASIYGCSEQGYPTEGMLDKVFYKIDSSTILSKLDQGKANLFVQLPEEAEEFTQASPDTITWTESDYLEIANALHLSVWNEPIEKWNIYWAKYKKYQCQDEFTGFDSAFYLFFKEQDDIYIAHYMHIQPLASRIIVEDVTYQNSGKWKGLASDQILEIDAGEALRMAELHGGSQARLIVENDCSIDVELLPNVYKHNFVSCPLCKRDWGWKVSYWPSYFNIVISPFTGTFTLQN